eukprot:m.102388 g.102388  ORF g.102388 m.102388 type:complete len:62 (+) comp27408_c0_seq4:300-485(+)
MGDIGSLAGGSSGMLTQGACSLLSAKWFSSGNNGKATAIAFASTYIGQCSSYLWSYDEEVE